MLTFLRYGGTRETSWPSIRTSPSSGRSNPAMRRNVVVFPQPDGPSSERNSPGCTSRSIASTAASEPKRFVTLRSSTSGTTADSTGGVSSWAD